MGNRLEKKLRAALDGYNGLVAALAGAFKDAGDASGKGGSVESPIFAEATLSSLKPKAGGNSESNFHKCRA